jgi:phosphoribosyl-ATP pyrophosphohydrolase
MAKKAAKALAVKTKPAAKAKIAVKAKPKSKPKSKPKAKPVRALPAVAGSNLGAPDARVLDRLWATILTRKDADPEQSHSARLLSRGTAKVAQKFGEEAVECLIEAVAGNRMPLVAESADVLYHLLVIWVDAGLRPEQIWAELERREGMSGIAEKLARPGGVTTKIP